MNYCISELLILRLEGTFIQNENDLHTYIHTYFIYSRSRLYIQLKNKNEREKVLLEKEVKRLSLYENSLKNKPK